tara:strand:+ start:1045 stop:1254 length:210 start_codon:yes stop_codon:yes gene_type:complete
MSSKPEKLSKVELTEQEEATIEAQRLEDKKKSEVAEQIGKILTDNGLQLMVNPNSRLNALEIMLTPARQ